VGSALDTRQAAKDDKVFEIIDTVLQRIVGDQATRLIYASFEEHYSLKQCEISDNIDVFCECLESILKNAALPIENIILNDILSNCGFHDAITLR